jgi:hypothetical protein
MILDQAECSKDAQPRNGPTHSRLWAFCRNCHPKGHSVSQCKAYRIPVRNQEINLESVINSVKDLSNKSAGDRPMIDFSHDLLQHRTSSYAPPETKLQLSLGPRKPLPRSSHSAPIAFTQLRILQKLLHPLRL